MIMIGTTNLTRKLDEGLFFCPTCSSNVPYRLVNVRPWLTLYFIPCLPLGAGEEVVKCEGCVSNFDLSVLEMTQEQHAEISQRQYAESVFRAAVLMIVQTETISEREIAELLRIATEEFGLPIDRRSLGQLCSQANTANVKPADYLHTVSGGWNQTQKRRAIQIMFVAASADGDLTPNQVQTLGTISERWSFTDQEFQDAILAVTDAPL